MWGTALQTGGTSVTVWGYLVVAILTLTIGSSLAESKKTKTKARINRNFLNKKSL